MVSVYKFSVFLRKNGPNRAGKRNLGILRSFNLHYQNHYMGRDVSIDENTKGVLPIPLMKSLPVGFRIVALGDEPRAM